MNRYSFHSIKLIILTLFFFWQIGYVQTEGTQKWVFDASQYYGISSTPAIGADGTIYVGTSNDRLYAVNPDGTQQWTLDSGGNMSSPAIGADGTIYVSNSDGNFGGDYQSLYAINPNGTIKWSLPICYCATSSPAIGADGTIYLASAKGWLYAINPDGTNKWLARIAQTYSSPVIGPDGTLYIGAEDKKLYAISPDGKQKWTFTTEGQISSSAAFSSSGTIYIGSMDSRLYAINPDGTKKWDFLCNGSIQRSSPAVGEDGTIYIGSNDNNVYAINPNGTKKWAFATGGFINSSPTIGADGSIYAGSVDKNLYAINSDGSGKWIFTTKGDIALSSPAIAMNGTIYVGSGDGKLYAIFSASPGLAASSWPKERKNYSNTANSFSPAFPAAKIKLNDQLLIPGIPFELDGSGSSGDGEPLGYQWSVLADSPLQKEYISFDTPDLAKTSCLGSLNGTCRIGLAVWNRKGQTSYSVTTLVLGIKWAFSSTGGVDLSSPAIGPDGTIYVGSRDYNLYAINPDGTKKWAFTSNGEIASSPSVGADGTIYVGSYDRNLYAINPDGTKKWSLSTCAYITSSPAVSTDGTVYILSNDDSLHAVGPNGTRKWSVSPNVGDASSSPAIGADGTIYIGGGGRIYAINPDGTERWQFYTADTYGSPALGADGNIYIGSDDKLMFAITPYGDVLWEFKTGGGISSSPAIGADGTIYIGTDDKNIYAINPDGTQKWTFATGSYVKSSPAVGADGTIYVGSDALYAINPDGTKKWAISSLSFYRSSPAIGKDGTIFIGSNGQMLYAIHSESQGLAGSSWPKFRMDNANSGDIGQAAIPIAIIKSANKAKLNIPFLLDGSSSHSTGQGTLKYEWYVMPTSPGKPEDVSFDNAFDISTQCTVRNYGEYHLGLLITDDFGHSSSAMKVINVGLNWTYTTGGYIGSSPAIAADGTVYIGSNDKKLYAINPDGTKKWSISAGGWVGSIAIGADGTIYAGSGDYKLYAVTPEGALKWTFATGGYLTEAAIAADATIYIGSNDKKLYAINPDGTQKWAFSTDGDLTSPSIGLDGTILLNANGKLYAINSDGSMKWLFSTKFYGNKSSPAIYSDGTIFISGYGGKNFYAINPDGTEKWTLEWKLPQNLNSYFEEPSIGADGTIYAGTGYRKLFAINPDGTSKWTFVSGGDMSSPAIGADGNIYVSSSSDHKLYAINPDGTILFTYTTGGAVSSAPSIGPDGSIYLGCNDNKLYSFSSSSNGLAKSSWSKFRQDIANNGNGFNAIPASPQAKIKPVDSAIPNIAFDLDGSDSFAGEGSAIQYEWYVLSSSPGKAENVGFANSHLSKTSCVISSYGEYRIALKLQCAQCQPSIATITIISGLNWAFATNYSVYSSPAIGADGTIYVGSNDNNLYAINPDGTKKWAFATGFYVTSSPAVGSDGTIYAGSFDTKFYAINPDGTKKWSFTSGNNIYSSPAIAADGTIYIGSNDRNLYAINPDGSSKWVYATSGAVTSSPAVSADGIVYVGSADGKVYALNPDGSLKWITATGAGVASSPALGLGGSVYIGSGSKVLKILPSSGAIVWEFLTEGSVSSSPAIGIDGTVYIGSNDKKMYSINPNGSLKWSFATKGKINSSPALSADGTVYFGSADSCLYAINPDGTIKWYLALGGAVDQSSPSIGMDGNIYIGTSDGRNYGTTDGTLYSVYSSTAALTKGLWPKFRHNAKNTGRSDISSVILAADFLADTTLGKLPLAVKFTDKSTGSIAEWKWDFGDGEQSSLQNPHHVYKSSGLYTVTLAIKGPNGEDSMQRKSYITVTSGGVAGIVSGRWTKADSPIYISGTIVIPRGDQLTIEPGTRIYFDVFRDSTISVQILGQLSAEGTQEDSISFKSAVHKAQPGFWGGLRFSDSSDSSSLAYVSVKNATDGIYIAAYSTSANVHISHCTVDSCSTNGIYFEGNAADVSNCTLKSSIIRNNGASGVVCHGIVQYEGDGSANPTITDNIIMNNKGHGIHCFGDIWNTRSAALAQANPVITGNTILGNKKSGIFCEANGIRFVQSGFPSIYGEAQASPIVKRNFLVNNTYGLSCKSFKTNMSLDEAKPKVMNNTFWSNDYADISLGYNNDENLRIINNIFANSDTAIIKPASAAPAYIAYNNVKAKNVDFLGFKSSFGKVNKVNQRGTACDSLYNISVDPLFTSTQSYQFNLLRESLCIDAGTSTEEAYVGLAPDMGAVEFMISTSADLMIASTPESYSLSQNYPNPFNVSTIIRYALPKSSLVSIKIYSVKGILIATLINARSEAGIHHVSWNGKNMEDQQVASGIYFYQFKADDFVKTMPMILLK